MQSDGDRLAVIGVGLLGGSFALRARDCGMVTEIVGCDIDSSNGADALSLGIIDRFEPDPVSAVANCSLVIVATPPRTIAPLLKQICPAMESGALAMDLGSTKRIVRDVEAAWEGSGSFVGAHPMAGTEKTGPNAATSELFSGTVTLLTPTESTPVDALKRASSIWEAMGVSVRVMAPELHDEIMVAVSHLPHLVAYALCCVAYDVHRSKPEIEGLYGGGFKDTSRIASTPPRLWRDVFDLNQDNLVAGLDQFISRLQSMRENILSKNWDQVVDDLRHARTGREWVLGITPPTDDGETV
jgi:prephenate dehydrogenase